MNTITITLLVLGFLGLLILGWYKIRGKHSATVHNFQSVGADAFSGVKKERK